MPRFTPKANRNASQPISEAMQHLLLLRLVFHEHTASSLATSVPGTLLIECISSVKTRTPDGKICLMGFKLDPSILSSTSPFISPFNAATAPFLEARVSCFFVPSPQLSRSQSYCGNGRAAIRVAWPMTRSWETSSLVRTSRLPPKLESTS